MVQNYDCYNSRGNIILALGKTLKLVSDQIPRWGNMSFKFLLLLVFFGFILGHSDLANSKIMEKPIKMLNWWKYLDFRIIEKLKKNGIDIDLSLYQSNEVAVARLLSNRDGFDVAVVSNINLSVLEKTETFEFDGVAEIIANRKYLNFLSKSGQCVPYLWGTTLFAYDSRSTREIPQSLAQLYKLKKQGFSIGVLDEPLEMAARIVGDSLHLCPKQSYENIFSSLSGCKEISLKNSKLEFSSKDFLTSYDEFLKNPKVATYGWQGSVFLNLQSAPWIKFNISKDYPIIGADYVCILKNRSKNGPSLERLKKFVETLTNRKNTLLNVESTQYFSPYLGDLDGLHPRVAKIYKKLIAKIKYDPPILIKIPGPREHEEINTWWKGIRYEKK